MADTDWAAVQDWMRQKGLLPGGAPPPPPPTMEQPPEAPPAPPPAATVPPPAAAAPLQDDSLTSAYKAFAESFSPERLDAAIRQAKGGDVGYRAAQGLNRAGMLISNLPTQAEAMPPWDAIKEFALRQGNAQQRLGAQVQVAQMDPNSPLFQAKLEGARRAGIDVSGIRSPMQLDALLAGQKAAGEAGKPTAETEAALASAASARASAQAKPAEVEQAWAKLSQERDLKIKELTQAAQQGDLNRSNDLTKQAMAIEAEMTRLRANISAENTGDADWQIGDQFSGGIKKLPVAAQEVLKRSPAARALLDASARAETLLAKHPGGVVTGDDAAILHRWLSEMSAQLNSVWGLGVMKQANMPMLEEAIANPTSVGAILKKTVKRQDFTRQLHDFQAMVKQRMVSEAGATGALTPKAGGYYEGFSGVSGKDVGGSGPGPGLSGDDARALSWAKANPNDPRATKILTRLGVTGG